MALSHELISQFAKLVVQDKKTNTETTVYGTIVVDGDGKYVQIDGSDQLTPIEDGTAAADANAGERVSVLIKNHTATVTGNVSSPAARTGDVKDLGDRVTEVEKFDLVLADRVEANEGYIKELQADVAEFGDLKAATAKIGELEAKDVEITGRLDASEATIENLKTTKLDAEVADVKFATIASLDATVADIAQLEANKASVEDLEAAEADIAKLSAEKASIKDLEATEAKIADLDATFATIENLKATDAKVENLEAEDAKINDTLDAHNAVITNLNASYATIDFANIKMAAVEELFTKSGIIKDLVVNNTSITGELVGVTLKGDLIEAGTLKADKLVVKGSDGIFYKLNVEAGGISASEAPTDGLHGSVIVAKSITAEKVNVKDLVAFGATIGGFHITDTSLYSGVKASVDNTTEGVYLDSTGQFAIGNVTTFIKYTHDSTSRNYFRFTSEDCVSPDVDAFAEKGASEFEWRNTNDYDYGPDIFINISDNLNYLSPGAYTFSITDTAGVWTPDGPAVIYIGDEPSEEYLPTTLNLTEEDIAAGVSFNVTLWTYMAPALASGTIQIQLEASESSSKLEISADTLILGSSKKNVEETIDEVSESVKANSEDLTNYIKATTKELENLQGQIDGSIMTWFYEYVPMPSLDEQDSENYPASDWTTTDLKNNHLGDLFYDTITGYCYRWQVQNNTYFWTRITDVDVTKALADAAKAQSTADNKRRVFVTTPTTPYDVGDLWTQGPDGDLMRCQTAKTASQSYAAADWVKASKYTDDTAANAAQADANALKTRVTSAETRITQNEKDIALRATKTEVTETLSGYYTKTESDANLKVSADSVKTEVSKTYATKQEVSDIEIGGRNLLLNSSFKDNIEDWTVNGEVFDVEQTVSGLSIVRADNVSKNSSRATAKLSSKNLLPYPYLQNSKTENGITITVNGDGSITIKGTCTANFKFELVEYIFLPATYTISGITGGSTSTFYLSISGVAAVTEGYRTFTLTQQLQTYISIYFVAGATIDTTLYPQLELGSTATPYTPYVDVSAFATYGKNLLDLEALADTNNWIIDGSRYCSFPLYLAPNTTYTFSRKDNTSVYGAYAYFAMESRIEDSNSVWFLYHGYPAMNKKVVNFTTGETGIVYINVLYAELNTTAITQFVELIGNAQIEKGSTATEYEPFVETKGVPVKKCGKNLLPYPFAETTLTRNGITYTDNGDGTVTVDGTATEQSYFRLWQNPKLPIGSYALSGCPAGGSGATYFMTGNGYNVAKSDRGEGGLFSVDENSTQVNIVIVVQNGTTVNNLVFKPQIELGSTATDYESYKEPATYTADEDGIVTIEDVHAPTTTVLTDLPGVWIDATYYVETGFVEKLGKQCLNIKHLEYGQTKNLCQDILDKIEAGSEYMVSGWMLTEGVTTGTTTNPTFSFQLSGAYDNDGVSTWWGRGSRSFNELGASETWTRVVWTFSTSDMPDLTRLWFYVYTRDIVGDVYFYDLKLEKGNKVTDWTPAPEDVDNALANSSNELMQEISKVSASIETTSEAVTLKALESYAKTSDVEKTIEDATAELKVSAGAITARVEEVEGVLENGEFSQVKIKGKEFKMDTDGFTVEGVKPDSNHTLKTTVSDNGMTVYDNNSPVLTANDEGVKAKDLHANTYLIIGEGNGSSRFEDYANHTRTACFWIGN